jgi:hypothetical protein
MKSSVFASRKTTRLGWALAFAFGLFAVTGTGCNESQEGDRCNPDLSHDECNAGLSCQQPVDCPENYCCPTSGTSSNPNCQPGCNGGQASICAAGGDADCPGQGDDAASTPDASTTDDGATDAPSGS